MYQKQILRIMAGFILLGSIGCREIKTTTTVQEEGPIVRSIAIKGEARDLHESGFPLPVDSSWTIARQLDTQDSSKTITTFTKSFPGISALQACYQASFITPFRVKVEIEVKKKFRWFYTYWEYRETYRAYNPFKLIPITNYLSDEELGQWIAAPDSDQNRDDQTDRWLMDNLFEEFYQTLLRVTGQIHHPELTKELLESRKSDLRVALMDSSDSDDIDEILAICHATLGTDALRSARTPIDSVFKVIEAKLEFETDVSSNSYANTIDLPGHIWASNGQITGHGQAAWQITSRQFEFDDFSMWAQSRKPNRILTIASGILVLILAAGLIITRIRHRAQ